MDDHARHHHMATIARMIAAFSALLFAVAFTVLVVWLVTADQKTKLYEADNVVCASQPFATQCFERKAK